MTTLRVLFVDDEPAILEGLQNQFRRDRKRWEMSFASSGGEALDILRRAPTDVVISDMRMPGMDGAELLGLVKREFPRAARIVLSGHADRDAVMRALPVTHQYVQKPCDVQVLRAIIERTHCLQSLLESPALIDVVGEIDRLPSVPGIYPELMRLAGEPNSTLADMARVVERDTSVTAKVLQIVNSAYFGLAHRVVAVKEAVGFLGVEILKGLVLGCAAFESDAVHGGRPSDLADLQARSTLTGLLARKIVNQSALADAAFTSGLLHDVGKIVLNMTSRASVEAARGYASEHACPHHVAERAVLGVSHAEVGAYLLGLWGIPFPIVEAVAFHHRPGDVVGGDRRLVAAVHVANGLVHEAVDGRTSALDPDAVATLGSTSDLERFRGFARALVEHASDTASGGMR